MWRLKQIEARNLCTFRELDYTLQLGVTTLVFGDNRDNESQRSNGSGKSALIEAVALAITGSTLRKVRAEEIISDSAEQCRVRVLFTNAASGESFAVERTLQRKGGSAVKITDIAGQQIVHPSVDAYNRYILQRLGISREELYNNFILSKYKYEDFLSSSDTQKKEIINRFSNGILVDQAIGKVEQDIAPLSEELRRRELEMASIDGRVEMLCEQIRREQESHRERERTRTERIAQAQGEIAAKRGSIREGQQQQKDITERTPLLDKAEGRLRELEKGESSLEACLLGITGVLTPLDSSPGDWGQVIRERKAAVAQQRCDLQALDEEVLDAQKLEKKRAEAHAALREQLRELSLTTEAQREEFGLQLTHLDESENDMTANAALLRRQIVQLSGAVDSLRTALAGTVVCPRCRHEFLTSDEELDPARARIEIEAKTHEAEAENLRLKETYARLESIGEERAGIRTRQEELLGTISQWKQRVSQAQQQADIAADAVQRLERRRRQITETIHELTQGIEGLRRRMFDEAFDRMETLAQQWEAQSRRIQVQITAAEGAVQALEEHIRQLETPNDAVAALRESLHEYRARGAQALMRKGETEESLHRLQGQQERFVQFKTFLANSKIEALGRITNEFLESIGSDIRIRFSGYTQLKSGKVREKISISLVRDGVDCGSFGKFSAGEAARVNLSTILAMQKLVNAGCEHDRGLDLLILDEIVEAVDEEGLSNMFEALNRLSVTALVVSHGNISESYPHKLIIVKENGSSRIEG